MKTFILSIALMFMSATSYATSEISPVEAFLASPEVSEAIADLQAAGFKDVTRPTMFQLSGACGWAGCDSTWLVAVTLSTTGANTRTKSVAAVVEIKVISGMTVRLVTVQ